MSSLRPLLGVTLMLVLGLMPLVAIIDRDGDGVSDVWTAQHPQVGEAGADDDGDGFSNRAEAAAGTGALDPNRAPAAVLGPNVGGGLRLRWDGVVHRRYRIETSTDLGAWEPANDLEFAGQGAEISHLVWAGSERDPRRAWRVAITLSDLDGDGLLDWEERALGTDPLVPAVAPPLPVPAAVPAFFAANLETVAAPLLANRKWTPLKIPGLREQLLDAHVNGRNRVWRNIAPGFANVTYDAKVDDGVVTLLLDLGGLVQSPDGGETWRTVSHQYPGNGLHSQFYSFDLSPADANLILVGGSYLARSGDGGRTWCEVCAPALPPILLSPNHGMEVRGYRTSFGKVRFNRDGSRVFAALGAFGHNRKQRDGREDEMATMFAQKHLLVGDATGQSFQAVALGAFAGIRCIVPHPEDRETVYASFGDGTLFVTRNATAATPTFQELNVPAGFQVIDLDVSPWTAGDLLVTLMGVDTTAAGKVAVAHDAGGTQLTYTDVPLRTAQDQPIVSAAGFTTARWNPRKRGQVVIGLEGIPYRLVSHDGLASFDYQLFPESLKHGEGEFYQNAHWFAFDRKTDLAVTWSAIGAWASRDGFATWEDLLMVYDEEAKLYGNNGLGYAECAVSLAIGPRHAYMATNDHGLFRSNGADRTRWRKISANPGPAGAVLHFPMGVAPDESVIYAIARGPTEYYSTKTMRLIRSLDQGESWTDATSLLTPDTYLPSSLEPKLFLFSPDARSQWLLFGSTLYGSRDGGGSFAAAALPFGAGAGLNGLAYDAGHGLLYVSSNRGLARSADGGVSWTLLTSDYVPAVGVTGSGDLVLGIGNYLSVVPYARIDEFAGQDRLHPYYLGVAGCNRATLGDSVEEVTSSLNAFNLIACAGDTIVVGARAGAYLGNRICSVGPLLSRDGGKTFRWAAYNLPVMTIFSAAIGPDEILLGCGGGAYRWDLKAMPVDPAPALN